MIHVGAMPRSLELDHACSGTWFARPCVPCTSPVGKADDLGAMHAAGCGEDVPLDAAGGVDVHSQFTYLAPALRLAPLAGELVGCWQHPSTGGS